MVVAQIVVLDAVFSNPVPPTRSQNIWRCRRILPARIAAMPGANVGVSVSGWHGYGLRSILGINNNPAIRQDYLTAQRQAHSSIRQ